MVDPDTQKDMSPEDPPTTAQAAERSGDVGLLSERTHDALVEPLAGTVRKTMQTSLPGEWQSEMADVWRNMEAEDFPEGMDEELVNLLQIKNADYPDAVVAHLASHEDIVSQWRASGRIDAVTHAQLMFFTRLHDVAYSRMTPRLMERFSDHFLESFRIAAEASGAQAETAQTLFTILSEQREVYPYFTVLGHGLLGFALNRLLFTQLGMADETAKKQALLLFTHHAGFPIDFVSRITGFEKLLTEKYGIDPGSGEMKNIRRILGINDGTEIADTITTKGAERQAALQKNREAASRLTNRIIDETLAKDASPGERQRIANLVALQYTADRLTPGHLREIHIKRAPIVIQNITSRGLEKLYSCDEAAEITIEQLEDEAKAAPGRAQDIGVSGDVLAFIREETTALPAARAEDYREGIAAAKKYLSREGTLLRFETLAEDIGKLERCMPGLQEAKSNGHLNDEGIRALEKLAFILDTMKAYRPGVDALLGKEAAKEFPAVGLLSAVVKQNALRFKKEEHTPREQHTQTVLTALYQYAVSHPEAVQLMPIGEGKKLIEEQTDNDTVFIVPAAVASRISSGDKEVPQNGNEPKLFGEITSLFGGKTTASVEVSAPAHGGEETPSALLTFSGAHVREMMKDPALYLAITSIIVEKMRELR